jgi:LysR family hydrogen peroxide-inducible transcriptional activator
MNISLQQLEYVVAVDTYRHYVTAAEKTFVTQPTLSMQIKKLEEQLGVVLFDRSKQPIVPTEIGVKIIEQARIVLNESAKIAETINVYQGRVTGEITLGVIPTLAPYLVPRFVGSFLRKYPEVKLTIKELMTNDIVEALKKERLDLGVIVTPLGERGFMERKLFYEEIFLFTKEQDLDEIPIDQLKKKRIWLLSKGHCFRSQAINLCALADREEEMKLHYESGSLESLKNIVLEEGGATLLPGLAAAQLDDKLKQHLSRISKEHPYREVSMIYNRSQAKKKLLELLEEELKLAVPESMLSPQLNVVEWN